MIDPTARTTPITQELILPASLVVIMRLSRAPDCKRGPVVENCRVIIVQRLVGQVSSEKRDRKKNGGAPVSDQKPSDAQLSALAAFRYALRKFLAFSEQASAELGLTMQWYQALLVIKTLNPEGHVTVGDLAQQLMIRDHSAAELVSRLVAAKLVKRKTDPEDRRRSLLIITRYGDERLAELALVHLERLQEHRVAFLELFKDPSDLNAS
jgi:DNA-binding MarR family transcriptional regulator